MGEAHIKLPTPLLFEKIQKCKPAAVAGPRGWFAGGKLAVNKLHGFSFNRFSLTQLLQKRQGKMVQSPYVFFCQSKKQRLHQTDKGARILFVDPIQL